MADVITFIQGNSVAFLVILYGALLLLSHVKGPLGDIAKWLLSGKLVKLPPSDPPVPPAA